MAADREEAAVGIRVFANSLPGFQAILKHRYADFKVNEVDLEGRVVRLTSLDVPHQEPASNNHVDLVPNAKTDPAEAVEATVKEYGALTGAVGAELEPLRAFLLQVLHQQAASKQPRGSSEPRQPPLAPLVLMPPIAAKSLRAAVHRLFKSLPGFPRLETSAVDPPAAQNNRQGAAEQQPQHGQAGDAADTIGSKPQCIAVHLCGSSYARGAAGSGQGQKRKWRDDSAWAGGSLRFTKFVLFKENMDSQHAISLLTKLLRVSHKSFAVAGTKDKRGVTVQQVTAFKLDPARLAALNPRLRSMRVGNFEFAADRLRLGDLQGNRFELVLRAVQGASAEAVAAAAKGLRTSGFVNYYGLQRFGTGATPTHRVGQALLCGQWRKAVRLLLTPRGDCPRPEQAEACRLYLEKGDVVGALRLMPRSLVVEPTLLQGMKQHGPNGFLNALLMLPRTLRTMYIHAYQSYLWNEAASHRMQTFGHAVVAGDLVLPYSLEQRSAARNGGRESEAAALDDVAGGASEEEEEELNLAAVHVVTAEEAAAGVWQIDDVVLPLPGSAVRYPEHSTRDVYSTLAAQDGVSLDLSPHGTKDFSITELSGAYRHVLHRPGNLEFETIRYAHPDADLSSTDLMVLNGPGTAVPPPGLDPNGDHLGLRLAFTLPPSCYATMLIRELTKRSSSVEYHRSQSAALTINSAAEATHAREEGM